MKFHRIWAIFLRHYYLFKKSLDKMVDTFYWITLDLLLWGVTSLFITDIAKDVQNLTFILISGVVLWSVTYRGQIDISLNLLEELWNQNLINLFVSPLKTSEWLASLFLIGIVKSIFSFIFGTLVGFLLYKVGVLSLYPHLIVFIGLLMMTGWWLGLTISSIILRYGTKVQALSWTLVWVISPFSAIYYPLAILPEWAQWISKFVPTSYVFEQSRSLIMTGKVDYRALGISAILNLIYIALSLIFFQSSFKKVLQKGLVKVY